MMFGGDMTSQLAQVGQFRPNKDCELYGEIETAQIIRFGKTNKTAHNVIGADVAVRPLRKRDQQDYRRFSCA
jgi:hypothetical protein